MISNYYSAAWSECGCFITCPHEHKTVIEAKSCISWAGGYVVAVDDGTMRSLTVEEEDQFQCAVPSHSTDTLAVEATAAAPAHAARCDSGFGVMTRIRVGDHWTWTTWMCFGTYAEAKAHAREGNKVVRFRSPEWEALRQQNEATSPTVMRMPTESKSLRGEEETLLEFVLRFLSACDFAQHPEPVSSRVKHDSIGANIIDLVLH